MTNEAWPWIVIAGLGAFHGLNPGMGWLFAVALGQHRHDRRVVWLSLLPIAAGHALSIAVTAGLLVLAGVLVDARSMSVAAGLFLIGWAMFHWFYGARHRVRIGMRTGLAGLGLWSFLMASAHGAGLMLWPVLMPLCFPDGAAADVTSPMVPALLGVGLHTLAMLGVTAMVAMSVYEWIGLALLRHAWINLDLVWTMALVLAGMVLLVA